MRIKLSLISENNTLQLPLHYNHILQGFIYSHLAPTLANWLHEDGFKYKNRNFKAFTFSRLIGKFEIKEKTISFNGPITLKIASPHTKILESLAENLIKSPYIHLANQSCYLKAIEIEAPIKQINTAIIKALSPIVIYSTLLDPQGKKKTYFYTPWEKEFSKLIIDNLQRKWMAFFSTDIAPPLNGAYIKPEKVNNKNLSILNFKGTIIKGWTGIYKLHLPEPYFTFAYSAGIGSKNSQGCGMIEVVREIK
ncbi:MAG: CRISPR-associated endoribonuclease Cas6 [Desulfonauticus sp.]|jgi:CRISPR-associated endoribonuclease Cas6|nr:CRISPR-associated endoribonuclease Cas6 [Desulfonauticus sp.]